MRRRNDCLFRGGGKQMKYARGSKHGVRIDFTFFAHFFLLRSFYITIRFVFHRNIQKS
jgi:hypothetical protein